MRASFTAALSLFLGVQGVTAAASMFSLTCGDVSLDGSMLEASCNDKSQNAVPTSLDLNTILTFQGGKLQWQRSPAAGFSSSCTSCALYMDYDPRDVSRIGISLVKRQAMKCTCADADASIFLDREIGNDNGKLYAAVF